MKEKLRKWWEGTYVPPERNSFILGLGHYERHWTSKAAHWAIDFYIREWKWTLTAAAGIIGALFLKHF